MATLKQILPILITAGLFLGSFPALNAADQSTAKKNKIAKTVAIASGAVFAASVIATLIVFSTSLRQPFYKFYDTHSCGNVIDKVWGGTIIGSLLTFVGSGLYLLTPSGDGKDKLTQGN